MIKFSESLNSYENMVIKNQFSLNYKHDCDLGLGNGTLNLCIQCGVVWLLWVGVKSWVAAAAIISDCLHNIIQDCPIWRGER